MGLIHTSVEDLKSTLRSHSNNYTIKELWDAYKAEQQERKRITVLKLIQSTVKNKWRRLIDVDLFENYPKEELDRFYYVRYPLQFELGKWEAVNVCLTGYTRIPFAVKYDTEMECIKACDITNALCGFTPSQVLSILGKSFE